MENKHVFEAGGVRVATNSPLLTALGLSCIYERYLGLMGRRDSGRGAKSIWRVELEQRKQSVCTHISA